MLIELSAGVPAKEIPPMLETYLLELEWPLRRSKKYNAARTINTIAPAPALSEYTKAGSVSRVPDFGVAVLPPAGPAPSASELGPSTACT